MTNGYYLDGLILVVFRFGIVENNYVDSGILCDFVHDNTSNFNKEIKNSIFTNQFYSGLMIFMFKIN